MSKKKFDLKELVGRQSVSQSVYATPVRNTHQNYSSGNNYYNEPMTQSYQVSKFNPQTSVKVKTQSKQEAQERISFIEQSISNLAKKFTMSKSESQKILLSLKEEIKAEEQAANQQIQISLKVLLQRFRVNQQELRKQLMKMMEWSFAQNERVIKEEMIRLSKKEAPEFKAVFNKINVMNQEVSRLLNSLNGAQYRRTIAEVVTRDFQTYIGSLRHMVASAKQSYLQNLGEIVCDRSKVELINDSFLKLFYINKKSVQRSSMEVIEEEKPVKKKGCCG